MPKASEVVRNWLILRDRRCALGPNNTQISTRIGVAARPRRERGAERPTDLPYAELFAAAAEPVLIVEVATQSIVEANPAAAALLHSTRTALIGAPLTDAFVASGTVSLTGSLSQSLSQGSSNPLSVRTRAGSAELTVTSSLFWTAAQSYLLVRLAAPVAVVPQSVRARSRSKVFDAIENASVGFLMTDSRFRIEYANPAFVAMIELRSVDEVLGKPLLQWLALTANDLARLSEQMSRREAVTVLIARVRADQRRSCDVEVSAVAVPDEDNACWGFSIRKRPVLN